MKKADVSLLVASLLIGGTAAWLVAKDVPALAVAFYGFSATAMFVLLGVYELATRRVPNVLSLTLPLLYLGLVLAGDAPWIGFLYGAEALVVGYILFLRREVGGGAVKMFAAAAVWSAGNGQLFIAVTAASGLATVIYYLKIRPGLPHSGLFAAAPGSTCAALLTFDLIGVNPF